MRLAAFLVAILYFQHRRKRVNGALFLYLLGTLLAYALFPYFPTDPPRVAFGGSDMPHIINRAAAAEFMARERLRDSLQRVSERARFVGFFGRLGAVRFSAGTQALSAGEC